MSYVGCKCISNCCPRKTFDGMAVATSVLHYLATHSGALSFFATHYSVLTDEFAYHPHIVNMHMASVLDDEKREVCGSSDIHSFNLIV
jgi:DNA mismatch repair ATPase MutS